VTILRLKLLFLIALIVVIVLALQGALYFTEVLDDSWWDGL
jgi:disulfide bond formation protein DsbB